MLVGFNLKHLMDNFLQVLSIVAGFVIVACVMILFTRILWMLLQGALFSKRNRNDFIHNSAIIDKVLNNKIDVKLLFNKYKGVEATKTDYELLHDRTTHNSLSMLRDTYLNSMKNDDEFKNQMILSMTYRFKDGYKLNRPDFTNTVLIFERLDDLPTTWAKIADEPNRKYLIVQEIVPKLHISNVAYNSDTLTIEYAYSDELPVSYQEILDGLAKTKQRAQNAMNVDTL